MVLDLFTQKHPEITFTTEPMPVASTDYWKLMAMRRDANMLPDIMQQDYAYIGEWASKGLLVALDDYASAGGTIDTSDIAASIVDGGRIGGKLYGISLGSNTQCFIIDTDAFTKAGVPLPADTWTWDDFETAAKAIHAKLNIWGYGNALYLYTPWKSLFLSKGQWVWNATNDGLGYTDDTPWINHWKMLVRLMTSGDILSYDDEESMFPSADIEKQPIVTGKSAMEQIQSNQLLALWTAANAQAALTMAPKRNFKLVAMPRIAGGGSAYYIKPSQFWSIVAGNQHPKESAMLIDFFTNDLDANKILAAERGVPVAGKVLTALKTTLSAMGPQNVGDFDLIDRLAKDARPLPPPDPAAWNDILNMVYKPHVTAPILHQTITPEQGVAVFRTEATQLLKGIPLTDGGVGDGGVVDAGYGDDAAVPPDDGGSSGHALMIVGPLPLVGNDVPIHDRLAQTMTVDVVPEMMATTADADGKAVVIISATASVAGTSTKFRDITAPVILMEPNLMPTMLMTGDVVTAHGTLAAQTQLAIVDGNSPLAGGFATGNLTVYSTPWRMVWGVPEASALKVATIVGNATQYPIFAYPTGSTLADGTTMAAGKRVAFFIHNSTANTINDNGLKLLDAAVSWSLAP
jgi:multiple sugar transport system substrate-binding protein